MRRDAKLKRNRTQLIRSPTVATLHSPKVDRSLALSNELDSAGRHSLFNRPAMKRTPGARRKNSARASGARAQSPGIRETEEAHALLQDQLHSLYWWVFNACRIKGFVRAKRLDQIATEEEQVDLAESTDRSTSADAAQPPQAE